MTGEMSRDEVTRENYPLHFAAADQVKGATVEPFDQYRGPYILVPDKGRYFLSSDDGFIARWWSEATDCVSVEAFGDPTLAPTFTGLTDAFTDLIENGGTPVKRE
jgi:hypothetical protein